MASYNILDFVEGESLLENQIAAFSYIWYNDTEFYYLMFNI